MHNTDDVSLRLSHFSHRHRQHRGPVLELCKGRDKHGNGRFAGMPFTRCRQTKWHPVANDETATDGMDISIYRTERRSCSTESNIKARRVKVLLMFFFILIFASFLGFSRCRATRGKLSFGRTVFVTLREELDETHSTERSGMCGARGYVWRKAAGCRL